MMFMVSGRMGTMAVRADTSRRARSYVAREFGQRCAPFTVSRASDPELRQHLIAGCMFFDADGSVIPKTEAFAMCGYQRAAP